MESSCNRSLLIVVYSNRVYNYNTSVGTKRHLYYNINHMCAHHYFNIMIVCLNIRIVRWYAFCMVSHVSHFRRGWDSEMVGEKSNPSHMENHTKCIFSHTLHSQVTLIILTVLRKVEDHENHVRWIHLTTVLYMGGGGGVGSMREEYCYFWIHLCILIFIYTVKLQYNALHYGIIRSLTNRT